LKMYKKKKRVVGGRRRKETLVVSSLAATASAEASLRRPKIGEKKVKYCAFFAGIIIESHTAVFTPQCQELAAATGEHLS